MSEKVVAVIQARMGSTRLPGKVMLPLGGKHVIERVVERLEATDNIDKIVVATSDEKQDDIIEKILEDVEVYRGSEENVLKRMFEAADKSGADIVVRITSDCPILSPKVIDRTIEKLQKERADYSSNIIERTFPRGFDVEAFTFESFRKVKEESTNKHELEHVTPYYLENADQFQRINLTSSQVFKEERLLRREDLRLTLDEADDYILLRKIFDELSEDEIIDEKSIIRKIDEEDLSRINENVKQKHE